jgi:outer membrane lipoprotein SlyB
MNKSLLVLFMAIAVGTTGCVRSLSGDTYSREEAQRSMSFREGTVTAVRKVRLEGTKSPVGAGAGAVVGGVAGSGIGSGRGAVVGTVLGAVVGGLAGAATEEVVTRDDAWELTIQMDRGESVVVVQEAGKDVFAAGERVRVVQNGSKTRVTH